MIPTTRSHLVGLLLGTENDWPTAFEALAASMGPVNDGRGTTHTIDTERVTIEPFNLRDKPRHNLVIDRLAYWYYVPREWLKKISLMDDVYLLNSPFTFQSMEKHSAYCAMMRLGLKIPDTVLVPYKNPLDNARWAYTAARYNRPFDLPGIAEQVGYPLYMKPFDGGGWRGVSRIDDPQALMRAYDDSGEMLMHLQASEDHDVFARALSIGPETMVMRYRPERPMHDRYEVSHDFLTSQAGDECVTINRTVNAFFRWEFNSCEMLVKFGADGQPDQVYPIDYANACPDVAVTSLHYYFPWAMKALVKWSAYCLVTGRRPSVDLDTEAYFQVAARDDLSYEEKLAHYRDLADSFFETDQYYDWCDSRLRHFDEVALEWFSGPGMDRIIVDTVRQTFPAHEQDGFIDHYRGLVGLWCRDEAERLSGDPFVHA
ncbi:MAG: hypothetical protein MUD05_12235 [Candidatus Nanopelagicales bacterium]|nr:hypothetical protein [Candidatus Nanopelagicales bacterium]